MNPIIALIMQPTSLLENQYQDRHPLPLFLRRLFSSLGYSALFIVLALTVGIVGYHWIAGFNWVDSFLNAAMILGGMGPASPLPTDDAKIFAGLYALFSGLIFVLAMGVLLAPLIHHLLHGIHIDEKDYPE